MLEIKFRFRTFHLDLYYLDKTFGIMVLYKDKMWAYEKSFPTNFKCQACGVDVEFQDNSLRLCDDCLAEFVSYWEHKIK